MARHAQHSRENAQQPLPANISCRLLKLLAYMSFAEMRIIAYLLPVCYMYAANSQVKYLKNEECFSYNLQTPHCLDVFNQSEQVYHNALRYMISLTAMIGAGWGAAEKTISCVIKEIYQGNTKIQRLLNSLSCFSLLRSLIDSIFNPIFIYSLVPAMTEDKVNNILRKQGCLHRDENNCSFSDIRSAENEALSSQILFYGLMFTLLSSVFFTTLIAFCVPCCTKSFLNDSDTNGERLNRSIYTFYGSHPADQPGPPPNSRSDNTLPKQRPLPV